MMEEGQTNSQLPSGSSQEEEESQKLGLPEQLQKIVPASSLPATLNRWNTNEELASILIAFDRHKEWLLDEPRTRPASGSVLMYNRKKVMFRRDGYCWKKRRDGKTNREDHMKLKVKGVECIYGSYVHSAILPTFHRRCYWLLQNPNVVLVHYLNVPPVSKDPKPSPVPILSGEMRRKEWTKEELVDQLRPMLASDRQGEFNPEQNQKVEETLEAIFHLLVGSQDERAGAKPIGVSVRQNRSYPVTTGTSAAAVSLLSHNDAVGMPSGPAPDHKYYGFGTKQGGETVHLVECVSTMSHVQVSTNTFQTPDSHSLTQLQHQSVSCGAGEMAGGIGVFPDADACQSVLDDHHNNQQDDASLQAALGMKLPLIVPAAVAAANPTSLSHLSLSTSHVHMASASASLHSTDLSMGLSLSPSGLRESVSLSPGSHGLLTGVPETEKFQGMSLLPSGMGPMPVSPGQNVFQAYPPVSRETSTSQGLSPVEIGMAAEHASQCSQNHLCSQTNRDTGSENSTMTIVTETIATNTVRHFGSLTQVAHTRPLHRPHEPLSQLPNLVPCKDIPLFAANPLAQADSSLGCDDTVGGVDSGACRSGGEVDLGEVGSGDTCDTLDGSFSSLPSTDLNLDLFLDLQDLEDCAADLATSLTPPPNHLLFSSASTSPSHMPLATSSPMRVAGDGNSGCSTSPSLPTMDMVVSGSFLNCLPAAATATNHIITDHQQSLPFSLLSACHGGGKGFQGLDPTTSSTASQPPLDSNAVLTLALSQAVPQQQDVIAHHLNTLSNCGTKQVDISGLWHNLSGAKLSMPPATNMQRTPNTGCLLISDFSPEWAYTEGSTKVLVAGPWCNTAAVYTCIFGDQHSAASLVQPGVLRCYTTDHPAGVVKLHVAQDGVIVSDSRMFEFRQCPAALPNNGGETCESSCSDWFDIGSTLLKQRLLERLKELERRFISGDKNSTSYFLSQNLDIDCPESDLVVHTEALMKRQWNAENVYPKAGPNGLTLLHLASALGFAKLISALIRWRNCNSSPALEYEVDTHSVDNQACTPLMWACARGQIDASLTLYHWNVGALGVCNKDGQLPLALARHRGHHNLAGQVEQLQQAQFKTPAPAQAKTHYQTVEGCGGSGPSKAAHLESQPMSPEMVKEEQEEMGTEEAQPMQIGPLLPAAPNALGPFLPPSAPASAKLVRRFSEQVISQSTSTSSSHPHPPLSKRYSVDLLTHEDSHNTILNNPAAANHKRDSASEPRLLPKVEREFDKAAEVRTQRVPSLTFALEPEPASAQSLKRKGTNVDRSFLSPERGQLPMDTDEGLVRSDSPFIDVETVSSDEEAEAEKQDDSKHQMVTLANQIIAAMPERIKLSPSKGDEEDDGLSMRTRSESHSSSAPSQGSPRPSSSSIGDDSGISTPMTDSLAFDEYRYTDLGTPASSLSPDSTCLPSPYSPYSFALDSPPPTTADFTEYFNAPATYMEKDFSQLTLSDQEQRKLYEAAKVIQNAYRHYRDKQQQQQHQKEIEAAVLIQSYYRRYKQYAYYKKMTHAAVLIQNQFRNYSAQKRKKNPGGTTQGSRRELERLKKGRNQSVIIQQRFRSHYQRKSLDGKDGTSAGGAAGDGPDSSPPSDEVQQSGHERSPPADSETSSSTMDAGTSKT